VTVSFSAPKTYLGESAFITGSMLGCRISEKALGAVDELGVLALSVVTERPKHCESKTKVGRQVQNLAARFAM